MTNRLARYAIAAGVAAFFLLLFALLFARAMNRELSYDEGQFISAGALLLRQGYFPYLDYPYFHLPNLAFVYAALFAVCDHLLLAARSFNVVCAWLTLCLVFALTAGGFRALGPRRWLIAGLAALVLCGSQPFRFTAGHAWNHDLPVLAAIAALTALWRSRAETGGRFWLLLSGALLGLAIGTRISFLPLLMPFLLLAFFREPNLRRRFAAVGWFSSGAIVALIPSLVLWASAPDQFIFDNFVYNKAVNRAYRESVGNRGVRLDQKILFPFKLLKFPQNLALVAAFSYLALWLPLRRGWRSLLANEKLTSLIVCLPFLFIGAFAPSPSYKQYYYVFVPFLLLAVVFGLAIAWPTDRGRAARMVAGILAAISLPFVVADALRIRLLAAPQDWTVSQVHTAGERIHELTSGRVLTLSPIFPLEGKAGIYKEFATGLFVWRVAAFAPEEQKRSHRIVDELHLHAYLAADPPAAILTGSEGEELRKAFIAYAREHNYQPVKAAMKKTLWLRPD